MVSDGRSAPYPLRSRLARHLRLLRDESGLTIGAVGRRLSCSGSKVSRIETGLCGITVEDAELLLDIYQVTGPRRDSSAPSTLSPTGWSASGTARTRPGRCSPCRLPTADCRLATGDWRTFLAAARLSPRR
ncbi:hypothetical protein Lfu02_16010 [Longispora fulva]|uniref:Transcriptional regulator with XRE-family HTH domain n=1 Tax=Longispora fulva TaxID=619741 RepID=A0A8J7GVM4_9ACTN|nr:helix-turn-helix transcriptional regulator [Longispora fulva]MBG6140390.1 transcriptional regulator with XRE-family HTH domain [Longispora fulva]GIG57229.1 hypothetical protein Lfu02_16010 [Longispora fulva]